MEKLQNHVKKLANVPFKNRMDNCKESNVKSPRDLGFLEKIDALDSWQLDSRFFPSKIGGKPAWLNLRDLPSSSLIMCPSCELPRSFLCQLYANIDGRPDCFHRTLFIFMCRTEKVRLWLSDIRLNVTG